jgi:hypothetical protein
MAVPFVKLFFLAVKQVSKPVASRIKAGALNSERLRRSMVSVGQRLNLNAVQLERIADGMAPLKTERVKQLNEKEALTRGADFLAEMVVYSVSASIIGIEHWMSQQKARKAAAKEAAKEVEARRLKEENEARQWRKFQELDSTLLELRQRLSAIEAAEERRQRSGWWSWR